MRGLSAAVPPAAGGRAGSTARRALLRGTAAWAGLAAFGAGAQDAAAARRIVSVGGALTETLYALGAEAQIVGVDTTSLFPAAARALPSVGYARSLSAEGVLSLRPTLVVATEDAGPPAVIRQLEGARVPLAVLDGDHRFDGVLARTRRLAELCGREEAGKALVSTLTRDWQAVGAQVAARAADPALPAAWRAPRVMFVMSHAVGQVRVAGRDTAADAMLRYAGAVNAVGEAYAGYKPLVAEAVIAAAPDVILGTDQGLGVAGGVEGLLRLPGLAQTPAGRARRVVAMDALLLLGFGPRLPQAVDQLARSVRAQA